MAGTSKKNGKAFEMTRAVILRPVDSFKSDNVDVQAIGFEALEVNLSLAAFDQLKTAKFPLQAELITEQSMGRGGIETTITGYKAPAPLKTPTQA
jgi:hypothetical protein